MNNRLPPLSIALPGLLLAALLYTIPGVADHHASPTASASSEAIDSAMAVLDDFMSQFNQRDINGWAATLNYPHVRFASGEVKVWNTHDDFAATPPFAALARIGWDHSHWLSREVVLASSRKVHIATVFQRFDANNQSIGVYESLYIVTKQDGRWGIQARSSLAP